MVAIKVDEIISPRHRTLIKVLIFSARETTLYPFSQRLSSELLELSTAAGPMFTDSPSESSMLN